MSSNNNNNNDDRNTRISTDYPSREYTPYFLTNKPPEETTRMEKAVAEEEGEGEQQPKKRKLGHLPVNVSMTQKQIDFIDAVRKDVKTSIWIRLLIAKAYPEFPDMAKDLKHKQIIAAKEN